MAGGREVESLTPSLKLNQPATGAPVRHLYVHVPYCHKICPYCSFYKHLPDGGSLAGFAEALLAEARLLKAGGTPLELETVYFGGGTPTLLSRAVLGRLLPALAETLDFSAVREWTMEVNPRTITPEKAEIMRRAGVSRVSLGVQAWDPPTLAVLGRDHAPEEAEEAFGILRAAAFPVVNVDLMFSVPGQSPEVWRRTLEKTLSLGPDHVSAYNLTYEEDTDFFERCAKGEFAVDEDKDGECFTTAMDTMEAAGFAHYEISNYSRPGMESWHNQSYWAGDDYAGLGPGAVSTIHGQRWKNIENTPLWQQGAMANGMIRVESEEIDAGKWLCERLALGLRTRQGIPSAWLNSGDGQQAVAQVIEGGFAEEADGHLRLTRAGKMVADRVISHLWAAIG
ncbi:MAG: Oxygen-independent coproporphyrinogen-III oxidase-like protein [Verrucomicrobiales bacterium]|nr:Oxygen-independent coproporphyrinogen-III oxidase-like protein [Verrucomicrobiales bacterium]